MIGTEFPFQHPATESDADSFLRSLGCTVGILTRTGRFVFQPTVILLVAILLLAAAVVLGPALAARSRQLKTEHFIATAGSIIVVMSVLLGLYQWHASVEQAAMEKYEREISSENDVEKLATVREMMEPLYPPLTPGERPNYDRSTYVYLQLDNLEYALERYRQGLASAYTTSRAVMTFASRCRSPEFRQRAQQQLVVASYSPVTVRVAQSVIKKF